MDYIKNIECACTYMNHLCESFFFTNILSCDESSQIEDILFWILGPIYNLFSIIHLLKNELLLWNHSIPRHKTYLIHSTHEHGPVLTHYVGWGLVKRISHFGMQNDNVLKIYHSTTNILVCNQEFIYFFA